MKKSLDVELAGAVELMVHPIYENEQIMDAVLPINLETWMYENRYKFKKI